MTRRVALVSGASRGIGLAVARTLTRHGWGLSLGMRNPAEAQPEFADDQIVMHDAEAQDEDAWAEACMKRYGRIDAVICCAGTMTPRGVVEADDAVLDAMLEVNVKSPRRLVKAAWEPLKASGTGRVIVLASLSGKRVKSAGASTYAMTKHAAIAFVHGVRQSGWSHGVRATAICPGYVDTAMARAITDFPPGHMSRPEDIAEIVRFALTLPNNASIAELAVNCQLEECY